jgi:hypothetical protein
MKIVGMENTLRDQTAMTSQQHFVESAFKKEALERADAVRTPLDPNTAQLTREHT